MRIRHFQFCFSGCLLAALLMHTTRAPAAPGDEHWSPQFGYPGTTNLVHAILKRNERLYAGGEGGTTNTTLQVFDGNQWSTLGRFGGNSPTIYDLAFVGNTLYAAGFFTNVDGAEIKGLARWDGSDWSSIGFNGNGYALAVVDGDLYVGGSFTNAGSVATTNIARWDGSAWHALGDGVGMSGNFVISLAIGNGLIYAGGRFTNSGSLAITNLAQWNGSAWSNVGGGVGGSGGVDRVYSLALSGTDLYAAGIFATAGPITANGVARWDGTNWTALGSGIEVGTPLSLAIFGDMLCVAGSFTSAGGVSAANFAVWNGSSWSAAGSGVSATAWRVMATATNVYVGGFFLLAGNGIMNQIVSWDGEHWSPVGAADRMGGVSSVVRSIAHDGTDLYVGGSFAFAGRTNAARIARYDGTNWWAFGTGLNSNVNSIAVVGTNVYAAGDFTGGSGGPLAYHLGRWNGSNWVALNNTAFATVRSLAARGNDLFVAGYFGITAANGTASWLTRWDGSNFWTVLAFDENTFNAFYIDGIGFTAMAVQDTNIYLSGHFSVTPCDPTWTDCTNSQNVMCFDGTYGRGMGTGLNSNATAIAVIGTDVYFAGPFTNAGGVYANCIARWDGNTWSEVGGGVVGRGLINSLAAVGTNLYASGTFTNVGGVTAARLARWDGLSWSALGSSTRFGASGGNVLALRAVGDDLYVGGTFTTAGGKPSYYLARWNENLNFQPGILRLSQPTGSLGGPIQFTVTAIDVPAYVLETSTDLTTWSPVLTNSITPYDHTDSNSTPVQFYRAHSLP